MDDLEIRCEEIIESLDEDTKTLRRNFNKKMQPVKQKKSIFNLLFY